MAAPIVTADIRTLKLRARQTNIGIALALMWLALDVLNKLPKLLRLALGIAVLYCGDELRKVSDVNPRELVL